MGSEGEVTENYLTNSTISPEEECLRERKWWCFLLSSIFTFLLGLFIVLVWRAISYLCCRKDPAAEEEAAAAAQAQKPVDPSLPPGTPGGQGGKSVLEVGYMTNAKD